MPFAPLLAALAPWITRFLLAKSAFIFAGFLGRLGLVIATNEFAIQPLVDSAITAWSMIPNQYLCWFGAFGVTKALSIMLSASTLIGAKKVFFAKAPA
ncbi:DUF2523 family protein [Aerolutibacter daejeonensis]|uniref:DUF2523 family protein n=1 Tax=Aerolutibacter daejeonensis TaxID=346181 RepID=UPI0006904804|nr:DUF2523 family protein [Lysobacter daejeonensis]